MPTSTITDTLTQTLTHLVRFPTVSDDQATNRAALDWVEQQLAGLPLTIKRLEHNGYPSLVATTPAVRDPKNPKLWLLGHIDVLIGPERLFEPKLENGRLLGRGVFDMKYGVATYITLLQQLGPELANYDLGLMLTSDEELAGVNGAGWLAELGYRGQAMLNSECGTGWHFETGAKGHAGWEFTADGRSAHGSRPWQGQNAIEQLIAFTDELKTNFVTEPCGDATHHHNTLNLGTISGGHALNQVPGTATANVDIRLAPGGGSHDDVTAWVKAAQTKVPGIKAEQIYEVMPFAVPLESAPVKSFLAIAETVLGHAPVQSFSHGNSDARYFAAHGVPTLQLPPAGGGQHAVDEWIDLKALGQYYEIVRHFAAEWAKVA